MRGSQKRIQEILLVVVSSFLLVQPVLNEPGVIAEIAIFYPAPAFEVAHWEALFSQARQANHQGVFNVFFLTSILITDPFNQVFHQLFPTFVADQQSTTLRC